MLRYSYSSETEKPKRTHGESRASNDRTRIPVARFAPSLQFATQGTPLYDETKNNSRGFFQASLAILKSGSASEADFLRWTDAFFQGALDYAGIQGFAPVGAKALNLVAGTHLLKVGSSLGRGQGFFYVRNTHEDAFAPKPRKVTLARRVGSKEERRAIWRAGANRKPSRPPGPPAVLDSLLVQRDIETSSSS